MGIISRLANPAIPSLLLLGLFLVLIAWAFTRNYRRTIKEPVPLDLLAGERPLDRLEVYGPFSTTKTILTNRRVLQSRFHWMLSSRKHFSVALADVTSIAVRRQTLWALLVVAALLVGTLNAFALLAFMVAIESKVHGLFFDTSFSTMPHTRVAVRTTRRRHVPLIARFYRNAHVTWATIRTEDTLAPSDAGTLAVDAESDFAWGDAVWGAVVLAVLLAVAQRLAQGHVTLDDAWFGPVYLGIVLAATRRGLRHGALTSLMLLVALLSVKFTGTGLFGVGASEAGGASWSQYLVVLVALAGIALLVSWCARFLGPWASLPVVGIWVVAIAVDAPAAVVDVALLGKLLLAAAWSIVLGSAADAVRAAFSRPVAGSHA
jgi:hypothetical protein